MERGPIRHATGRRAFLGGLAATAGTIAASRSIAPALAEPPPPKAVYLVPGYRAELASYRGESASTAPELRRDFPKGYDGAVTMIARMDEKDGSLRRALMPIGGHQIAVRPRDPLALWNSMNGPGLVTFDPATLKLDRVLPCHKPDYMGGGHSAFTAAGDAAFSTERRRQDAPFTKPADYYGRLVVRDARDFKVLEAYDLHGIGAHEVRLTEDGRHAVIANYGSVKGPAPDDPWRTIEPCVTVLEAASGKLVYKRALPGEAGEVRHLAAPTLDRIAAHVVVELKVDEYPRPPDGDDAIAEFDPDAAAGSYYLPGSLGHFDAANPAREPVLAIPEDRRAARQGQSVAYDPVHDEMIATFASSHSLVVLDAASGRIKRTIGTERLGLRYPRGIGLHPDGKHYAVSGGWQGIYLFRRGAHEIAWDRTLHPLLFDHSHMTVV